MVPKFFNTNRSWLLEFIWRSFAEKYVVAIAFALFVVQSIAVFSFQSAASVPIERTLMRTIFPGALWAFCTFFFATLPHFMKSNRIFYYEPRQSAERDDPAQIILLCVFAMIGVLLSVIGYGKLVTLAYVEPVDQVKVNAIFLVSLFLCYFCASAIKFAEFKMKEGNS